MPQSINRHAARARSTSVNAPRPRGSRVSSSVPRLRLTVHYCSPCSHCWPSRPRPRWPATTTRATAPPRSSSTPARLPRSRDSGSRRRRSRPPERSTPASCRSRSSTRSAPCGPARSATAAASRSPPAGRRSSSRLQHRPAATAAHRTCRRRTRPDPVARLLARAALGSGWGSFRLGPVGGSLTDVAAGALNSAFGLPAGTVPAGLKLGDATVRYRLFGGW